MCGDMQFSGNKLIQLSFGLSDVIIIHGFSDFCVVFCEEWGHSRGEAQASAGVI